MGTRFTLRRTGMHAASMNMSARLDISNMAMGDGIFDLSPIEKSQSRQVRPYAPETRDEVFCLWFTSWPCSPCLVYAIGVQSMTMLAVSDQCANVPGHVKRALVYSPCTCVRSYFNIG